MSDIGDGSGMVKHHRLAWWQIAAVVVMAVMLIGFGVLVYLFIDGEALVGLINKATVGEGQELLKAVRDEYEYIAVTGYEQKGDRLNIEFKYYKGIEEAGLSMTDYGAAVREYIEKYINDHPDCFINTKSLKCDLRFPEIHYSNYPLYEAEGTQFSKSFSYATYERSELEADEFFAGASQALSGRKIAFIADKSLDSLSEEVIKSLPDEIVIIGDENSQDYPAQFANKCKEKGISTKNARQTDEI